MLNLRGYTRKASVITKISTQNRQHLLRVGVQKLKLFFWASFHLEQPSRSSLLGFWRKKTIWLLLEGPGPRLVMQTTSTTTTENNNINKNSRWSKYKNNTTQLSTLFYVVHRDKSSLVQAGYCKGHKTASRPEPNQKGERSSKKEPQNTFVYQYFL